MNVGRSTDHAISNKMKGKKVLSRTLLTRLIGGTPLLWITTPPRLTASLKEGRHGHFSYLSQSGKKDKKKEEKIERARGKNKGVDDRQTASLCAIASSLTQVECGVCARGAHSFV